MTAEEWIRAFAHKVGVTAPSQEEMDEILRLAGVAAHASERIAAKSSASSERIRAARSSARAWTSALMTFGRRARTSRPTSWFSRSSGSPATRSRA